MSKETKVSAIPSPPVKTDPQTRRWMESVKTALDVRLGHRGNKLDQAVTWRNLGSAGVLLVPGVESEGRVNIGGSTITPSDGSALDLSIPPAPTGLAASATITNIYLSWDSPPYSNHSYTEIWRAPTDDLGSAVSIGVSNFTTYVDPVDPQQTYYYWIRFVTEADVRGAFNATAGVSATTGQDPAALLQTLQDAIDESQLTAALNSRITAIDDPVTGSVATEVAARIAAISGEADARVAAIAQEVIDRNAAIAAEVAAVEAQIAIDLAARDAAISEADGRLSGQIGTLDTIITATQDAINDATVDALIQIEAIAVENAQNRNDFEVFRDAVLAIDPESGEISLQALEIYQTANDLRVTNLETSLDSAEAEIALKASTTEVNAISSRLSTAETTINSQTASINLKASQAEMDDVSTRLDQAEIDIDGAESAIALRATQAYVDDVESRLSTAEVDIDGAEAAILLKADQLTVDGINTRLTSAEVDIDGAEAAILLKADQLTVDGIETRLSAAEVDIDGAEAAISLKASQTEVDSLNSRLNQAEIDIDGAEAAILLKASQSSLNTLDGEVTAIESRLSTAEIDIDGAEAAILLKADQSFVNGINARLTTAEVDIDGAEAAIALKAEQTTVDAVDTRLQKAEVTIDAQDGQITQQIVDANFASEGILENVLAQENSYTRLAVAEFTLSAVQDEQVAEANARLLLETQFNDETAALNALVLQEQTARSNADSAIATDLSLLEASVDSQFSSTNASIVAESVARADADAAEASRVDGLLVTVNNAIGANSTAINNEAIARADADAAEASRVDGLLVTVNNAIGANSAAISNEAIARADADAAEASRVDGLLVTVNNNISSNTAAISNEAIARADADAAEAARVDGLLVTVNNDISANTSAISNEAIARANADGALASDITTLSTTVGDNTAAIQTQATSIGGLEAKYTVKVDVNGNVAGYGLASVANDGVVVSTMQFAVDKFFIVSPGSADLQFAVDGGKVVMDAAYIKDATITSAKIADLVADKITAGTITASVAMNALAFNGGSMSIGTPAKFTVDSLGNVEAKSITIRDSGDNVILSSGSGIPVAGITGLGAYSTINQITAANASTLIDSAAIGSAQIGTAAIGTAAIQDAAVDTLQLAGQAVTIPEASYIEASTTTKTGIISKSIISTGNPIIIIAGAAVEGVLNDVGEGSYSGSAVNLILKRNGTTLQTHNVLGVGPVSNNSYDHIGSGVAIYMHTPGAGTHTYTVDLSTGGESASNRSIVLLEVKR